MNFPFTHRVHIPHLGVCDRTVLDEQRVVFTRVPGEPGQQGQKAKQTSGFSFLSAALLISVWLVFVLQ